MVLKIIIGLLLSITSFSLMSQKFEIEDQVDETKVPGRAVTFIAECLPGEKIKWYLEKSQKGISYEGKTNYKGHTWSIEFDKDGLVQDVEMRIELSELPVMEREKIENTLGHKFEDYKINKIQYHWENTPSTLKKLITNYPDFQEIDKWYEIVITENTSSAWKQKEVLINPKGEITSILEIVTRPTDNMDF